MASEISPSMAIPHPGLDAISNTAELKKQCPAFATGCPYAKVEENGSLSGSFAELSKCPAFQNGCPFSDKSKEEIAALFANIPKEHPVINVKDLPATPEGTMLAQILSQFLEGAKLEKLYDDPQTDKAPEVESEILKDPQLAAAMREGTKAVHKAAENSVFTRRFLKGEINRDEYGRYLTSLYFVYKSMEALLEKHKENPAISVIYFPFELNREQALLQDLEYFYGRERLPSVIDPATMTPAVKEFVEAMEMACQVNPALLVAHSYSRYLGDLSGGQILAKRLKKHVLQLRETDGAWDSDQGLQFYLFNNIGNENEFKAMYRDRLNTVPIDAKTRDLIVNEAVRSFELNIALFDEIQKLSEEGHLVPTRWNAKTGQHRDEGEESSSSKLMRWSTLVGIAVAAVGISGALYYRYRQTR